MSSQGYGSSSSHVWIWELDYKEIECLRIDAFEVWCWRRLLRVPWTARISNQSILKEISPEYSLEGLMMKLRLQYFDDLMRRTDFWKRPWCWERLKAGGQGDDRGWEGWMASPTQWTWVWVNSGSWWCTGRPGVLQSVGLQRVGHDWATELNWTEHISLTYHSLPSRDIMPFQTSYKKSYKSSLSLCTAVKYFASMYLISPTLYYFS